MLIPMCNQAPLKPDNPARKRLSDEEKAELLRLAPEMREEELAVKFGIAFQTVRNIKARAKREGS